MSKWPHQDHGPHWADPPDVTPVPRRRRRWLTPTSTALLAVALGFAGFYAGVREEKASATGSGATRPAAGAAATRSTSTGPLAAAGAPRTSIGSSSGLATGTVTRVDGDTVYIKSASGNTVQVRLLRTTTVSKSLSVSGHTVRPGDTVAIQGTEDRNGTIKPTSISDSGDDSTATTSTTQAGAASGSG